ncbi:MAG: late competence development ComFB family protein [Clostridiales bacterium]|nr:late competence development ComFB family protein [Clostridiales bacterium]
MSKSKSKKELDRDLMFSKIMPALTENPFSSVSTSSRRLNSIPEVEADSISVLRDRVFLSSGSLDDPDGLSTMNVMENLVLRNIDSVIRRFNVCGCDRCRCDICACALNQLPPHYIVAQKDKIEKAESEISQKLVIDALIKAVIQVRAHPRH